MPTVASVLMLLLLLLLPQQAAAVQNGFPLPQLGWNSWSVREQRLPSATISPASVVLVLTPQQLAALASRPAVVNDGL
jgi:hypothetical protein